MRRISFGLIVALLWLLAPTPAYSWQISEEKDDFTEQKKFSAMHFEGGFVFFFNCTTGEGSYPELRIATTTDFTSDLKGELELQFKGPNTPLIKVTSELTSKQSNKVLMISRESDSDDVLGLMRAFAETKNHVSFRISDTADSTKIPGRGFGKIFKQLTADCKFADGVAM